MKCISLYAISLPDYHFPHNADSIINGYMYSDTIVPQVDCPACERRADIRGHAIELPPKYRRVINRIGKREATCTESKRLLSSWRAEFAGGPQQEALSFGKSFPPWKWIIPSIPSVNAFYWNLRWVIVGESVKSCFDRVGVTSIVYSPVTIASVGTLDISSHESLPTTDDVVQLTAASTKIAAPSTIGEFYFFEPTNNTEIQYYSSLFMHYCPVCGGAIYDHGRRNRDSKLFQEWRDAMIIPYSDVPEADVFVSHIYGGRIIVTEEIYNECVKSVVSNFKAINIKVVYNK